MCADAVWYEGTGGGAASGVSSRGFVAECELAVKLLSSSRDFKLSRPHWPDKWLDDDPPDHYRALRPEDHHNYRSLLRKESDSPLV